MQVIFNSQTNNNQPGFKALRKVSCGENVVQLIGEFGYEIQDKFMLNLSRNQSFKTLCEKYDVYVNVIPFVKPVGLLLNKGLALEIFSREINKGGFLGLFRKKPPMEKVSGYMAQGPEAHTRSIAEHIIDSFINAKDGLSADIEKFLDKSSKTAVN